MSRYHLSNLIGNPTDSSIAIASLIFGGVLGRHPGLRFGFVHGGGFAPYQISRWDHGWEVRPEARVHIDDLPSAHLRNLFFDSLTHDQLSLEFLGRRAGVGPRPAGLRLPLSDGLAGPGRGRSPGRPGGRRRAGGARAQRGAVHAGPGGAVTPSAAGRESKGIRLVGQCDLAGSGDAMHVNLKDGFAFVGRHG